MVASRHTIDQVIDAFQRAARGNRELAARSGNVVELNAENGRDVMITADLHGHRLNFNRLLQAANLPQNPERHLILQEVCHGGPLYPSGRGCMSHTMLEDVARLQLEFPGRVHFILSNHELAEMIDYPITKANRLLNLQFRSGLQEMYGDACDAVRRSLVQFLASCPLAVRLQGGAFVSHSAPERLDEEPFEVDVLRRPLLRGDYACHGPVFRLVWGRDYRQRNADLFADLVQSQVLVHGHEPCSQGFATPNSRQIILDCSSDNAAYLLAPLQETVSYCEMVSRIRRLN